MKKRKVKNFSFSFGGAVVFFVCIAFIMQIAIFTYDYICDRTNDKGLIAVLILILILMLSTFCTLVDWIRRKLTVDKPTQKILQATERIAEGDFSTHLDIVHDYKQYDQYDLIMENLNKMAMELQKNEVLKTDFISNVSHEIKTPLAVIQNYAMLLQDETLDAQTRKDYTQTLISATRRITDLITNILKLNKLENQQIQQKPEVFSLTESLANCIVEFEIPMETKNICLDCDLEDVTVFSTQSLLEIVWTNLLSNAIKFTPQDGNINVSLKQLGNNVQVAISDDGCGMTSEVGAKIFDKFYQGDTSHATQGNGLGLALVKRVIDILGGEISVSSEVGKGSTFTILLKDVVYED